jgi:hypothetical protein
MTSNYSKQKSLFQLFEKGFYLYLNKNYFFTPILLHVFNTKSKIRPITAVAIENTNFRLSSDKISEFQSKAYRLMAIKMINNTKNTL